MKNLTSHKVRSMFLLGGVAAMMGATMMVPNAARADEAQNYKYGATALGILGAVLAVKGKTLPAVIAGAAGYYAYQKGADIQEDQRYDDRYNSYPGYDQNDQNRYGNNNSNGYYGDRYDNSNRYDQNNNRYGQNDNRYDSNSNRYNRNDNRNDSSNYYGNRYDNSNNSNNRYDRNDRNNNRNTRYNDHSYSVR